MAFDKTTPNVEKVLASWSDYSYLGSPKAPLDCNRIVARLGVSKSTAYQIKARAEYLRSQRLAKDESQSS